jgi:hypothetical protein
MQPNAMQPNQQTFPVNGQAILTGASLTRVAAFPVLPGGVGSWSIRGRVHIQDVASPNQMVEYTVNWCGILSGTASILSATSAASTVPSDGGTGQGFAPAGLTLTANNNVLEMQAGGVAGHSSMVSWFLDMTNNMQQ